MNVRNWSFFSNKEVRRKAKEHILDTICIWSAIGLLWYAFVSMVGEHFPEFLPIDWRMIGLFLFVLWLGYDWPKLYMKKLGNVCRIVGFVIPVVYLISNLQSILNGFYKLLELYLPHVNNYYKTRFFLQAASAEGNQVAAFSLLCMILWCMVWLLAYGWNNRVLLALFPFLALGLELAVGLSPHGNGILIWFFAAILLSIIGGTSLIKKVIVLACVGMSVFLSIFFFQADIERLAAKESKQALLRWQHNLNIDDFNPFRLLQIDLHFDWEPLNNNSPQYMGKEVLEIESSQSPTSVIYLRGFYGTTYEDGNWTYDASAFEEACAEVGKSTQEVAAEIFQMPYERMQQYLDINDSFYNDSNRDKRCTFRILYTGTTGNVAYVPYLSDYSSLDEEYSLRGDYLVEKSIWDSSIQVQGLTVSSESYHWGAVNNCINVGTYGWTQEDFSYSSFYYNPIDLKGQLSELSWINSLADAYLQIPTDAEFVEEAAINAKSLSQTVDVFIGETNFNGFRDVNEERIAYAIGVANYLGEQMSYSLRLDNLPMGRDPIDYALNNSHEGYCMHFASAGTLILRELGVPARYVSGYAVEPSAFAYEEGTGVYKAEIGDYMAHTWVEIYLDNIGWVPVEMTPGSSLDSLPTDEEIRRWESQSNAHRQTLIDRENASETEESEAPLDNTEEESEESESEETEEDTQKSSESENSEEENKGGTGNKTLPKALLKGLSIVGILGLVVLVVALIWTAVKRWISNYEKVLLREMNKNMTRKVVKRINRRLYITLRITNWPNGLMRKWTDNQYRDVLVKGFTDVSEEEWNRYMDIVKKNHYSHETISIEEMQYVYECYKKTDWFNKSLTRQWHNKG